MKKAASARAELPTDIENPEQYGTILIGDPNGGAPAHVAAYHSQRHGLGRSTGAVPQ